MKIVAIGLSTLALAVPVKNHALTDLFAPTAGGAICRIDGFRKPMVFSSVLGAPYEIGFDTAGNSHVAEVDGDRITKN